MRVFIYLGHYLSQHHPNPIQGNFYLCTQVLGWYIDLNGIKPEISSNTHNLPVSKNVTSTSYIPGMEFNKSKSK